MKPSQTEETVTIEKYCKYCEKSFSKDSSHWSVKKGTSLECKQHAKERRMAKRRLSNLDKFGTEEPLKDPDYKKLVNKKRTETMESQYGSSNAMLIPHLKDKQISTLMQNYGVKTPSKSELIKERTRQTCLSKYGVETNLQIPSVIEKAKQSKKTNLSTILSDGTYLRDLCATKGISRSWAYKVYNHSGEDVLRKYIENYNKRTSCLELWFMELIKDFKVLELFNKQPNKNVPYRPDFEIKHGDKTLYVNVDGLYYHSEIHVDNNYHKDMRLSFEHSDLRLMQFRGDEIVSSPLVIKSMVMNYFGICQKVYARKCRIEQLNKDDSVSFFKDNHLMKAFPAGSVYGLYNNDELVAAMSVSLRGTDLHIERFCNKIGTSVHGGFSRLLSAAIKSRGPKRVVSFCDMRYSSGESYLSCGFEEVSDNISFRWTNGVETYNRSYCVANMDERNLPEGVHATEKKLFRIYDAGQRKFIKEV